MAFQDKKFLDAEGITHLVRLLDEYPNNQVLGSVIDAIEGELDQKYEKPAGGIPASDLQETYLTQHQDISGKANVADLAAVATSGSYNDLLNKPTIPEVPVQDVQINGTSILQDGVANVPIASQNVLGTVKGMGIRGIGVDGNGNIYTVGAGNSDIRTGTDSYKSIVPDNQHRAAFYGLAKAAGDTTQSASSNAVGTYTTEAKAAIQNMLGVTDALTTKLDAAEAGLKVVRLI